MHRILTFIAGIFCIGIIISCSGMEETAQESASEEMKKAQQYPSWYPEQEVVSEADTMYGYATAVDKDSAAAVSKASAWAESVLKTAISDKLENIRTEAMKESGDGSGLNDSDFLIALREVKEEVSPLVETDNNHVKTVEGYDSYRSFTEIRVPKDKLILQIDERLSAHQQAWDTMKESKAFESF